MALYRMFHILIKQILGSVAYSLQIKLRKNCSTGTFSLISQLQTTDWLQVWVLEKSCFDLNAAPTIIASETWKAIYHFKYAFSDL